MLLAMQLNVDSTLNFSNGERALHQPVQTIEERQLHEVQRDPRQRTSLLAAPHPDRDRAFLGGGKIQQQTVSHLQMGWEDVHLASNDRLLLGESTFCHSSVFMF